MRVLPFLLAGALWASSSLDVRDFGAKGDGVAKDTAAIQKAIDSAAARGGGTVLLPAGRYLAGTIRMKSNVTLHLAAGATLAASPDNGDFDPYETLPFKSVSDNETTYFRYGLITGDNVENIAILGQGTVDGNRAKRGGPKTISLKLCRRVAIRGITVKNSPNYSICFLGCDYVDVDGVTVLNGFADGIDPDSSRYVRISNCFVDCYDDAICPKASPSLGYARSTENLTVTNCVLSTECNNFKFGTESSGDFKNVTVSNCTMFRRPGGKRIARSGIAIESVDGARIDGVVVSNIAMQDVHTPVFIRLGNRGRGLNPPVPGYIRNVSVQNVVATGAQGASSVTGIPGHPVRRVYLDAIRATVEGGAPEPGGLEVPEVEAKYPESTMFGTLPAYGLYARHVEGLGVRGMLARWGKPDARPALVFDDVRDLDLDGLTTETATRSQPVVWMNDVIGAALRAVRVPVRVTGVSRDVER
jgi:polygalacturonase